MFIMIYCKHAHKSVEHQSVVIHCFVIAHWKWFIHFPIGCKPDKFRYTYYCTCGIEVKIQFVFSSYLSVIQTGKLFYITIQKLNLENYLIITNNFIDSLIQISGEEYFSCGFFCVFIKDRNRRLNIHLECLEIKNRWVDCYLLARQV